MPKPKLTVIEGGGEPRPIADDYESTLKRIEESLDKLLIQLDESPQYTSRSWRAKQKWRP